jgi:hypothetical protein
VITTYSVCYNSPGTYYVTVKFSLYDTLCDSRSAQFSWQLKDDFGVVGGTYPQYESDGSGCNTEKSFTHGPYLAFAYDGSGEYDVWIRACNSHGCSYTDNWAVFWYF